MTDLNSVAIIGRLSRDGELTYSKGGMPILKAAVAVGRSIPPANDGGEWKNEVSFIDVVLFGKSGENAQKWATKGKQVAVLGEIRQDRWTDDQSGQSRSKIYIVASRIQPLADPKGTGQHIPDEDQGRAERKPAKGSDTEGAVLPDFNDDIPF